MGSSAFTWGGIVTVLTAVTLCFMALGFTDIMLLPRVRVSDVCVKRSRRYAPPGARPV